MRDDFDTFFAELDRRYALSLVPRVRIGTVTAVASPTSCSLTLPGETTAKTGVPIVTPVVPAVGQLVRVELVADHPVVVDVLGGSQSGDDMVEFKIPSGSTDTGSSTSYTTWLTLGNVDVPEGITSARYQVNVSGVFAVTASQGLVARLTVGGVAATNDRALTAYFVVTTQPRFDYNWAGRITGLTSGARSVVIQTKVGVSTGALRADSSSLITAAFGWEP
jgi:hypothetical protein